MLTEQQLQTITKTALAQAKKLGATQTEVVIWTGTEELTRFANNHIHQSVALTDNLVHIRVVVGKKIGVARANQLDTDSIAAVVRQAYDLATHQQEDPDFMSLPNKAAYTASSQHYDVGHHIGADGRASAIGVVVAAAKKKKLVASGAFSESEGQIAIANSEGVWGYQQTKSAHLSTIVMGVDTSGFASHDAKVGSAIDVESVAKTAVYKATHGKLQDIEAGEYEVILEPAAVAELMDFYAFLGPNGRMYHEEQSFYHGNIGKQVLHPDLSIHDDPFHTLGYPTSFDFEGYPKKKQTLVDHGVLSQVVYDSYHATKYKQANTGHALLAPNTWGPTPTHLVIEPGKTDVKKMIKKIKKGLLVTRFWYTRVVQQKQMTLTGMTRDGTFYIENGKIVGRVRNLRYTQSVVEALGDIKGIGKELHLVGSEGSPSIVPALHLGKFRFTGTTKHG